MCKDSNEITEFSVALFYGAAGGRTRNEVEAVSRQATLKFNFYFEEDVMEENEILSHLH